MITADVVQFDMFAGLPARAPPVETPAARASDPQSSHEAAAVHTATGKRAAQQARALEAVRAFPERTSAEIASRAGLDRYELARRLPEIRTAGFVENVPDESQPKDATGQFPPLLRKCNVTGKRAMLWRPKIKAAP